MTKSRLIVVGVPPTLEPAEIEGLLEVDMTEHTLLVSELRYIGQFDVNLMDKAEGIKRTVTGAEWILTRDPDSLARWPLPEDRADWRDSIRLAIESLYRVPHRTIAIGIVHYDEEAG